jgi:hypothetical protein
MYTLVLAALFFHLLGTVAIMLDMAMNSSLR